MSDDFFIFSHKFEKNAATLTDLQGVDFGADLNRGISHAHDFPADVSIRMSEKRPNDALLSDSVDNVESLTIISARLKQFMESRKISDVEYFPITILDHRGDPVDERFFIAHPVNNVDCLDVDACSPRWCEFNSDWMRKVKALVIVPEKVPGHREFFRPRHYDGKPIISKTLAEELERQQFTGIGLVPVSSFKGRI